MALTALIVNHPSPWTFPFIPKYRILQIIKDFDIGGKTFPYTIGVAPRRFTKAWVNQHVICSACAAARGDLPGSQAGFEQLAATNLNRFTELTSTAPRRLRLTNDQADDLFIAAFQTWVWPDVSSDEQGIFVSPGDNTFDLFTFEKSSRTQQDLMQSGLVQLN